MSRLGLPTKKGGADGGPILGPMLKSLHRGTKGGVSRGSGSATERLVRGNFHTDKPPQKMDFKSMFVFSVR